MRFVRSMLAILLTLGLAVTPVAARAATVMQELPSAATGFQAAAMPDCHHMANQQHEPAQHEPGSGKSCPDCAKRGPCDSASCQLKCFKVVGALPGEMSASSVEPQQYGSTAPATVDPRSWKPRIPPPRA